MINNVSRRTFLKGLGITGGGVVLGVSMPMGFAEQIINKQGKDTPLSPDVFIEIANDGLVTIYCHRSEMGPGCTIQPACHCC